jgi:hypothetical protein
MVGVLIWENNWGTGAIRHPGHAALKIQNLPAQDRYISWWPAAAQPGTKSGPFNARPATPHTIQQDFRAELGQRARQGLQTGRYIAQEHQHNEEFLDPQNYLMESNEIVTDEQGVQRFEWVRRPDLVIWLDTAQSASGTQGEKFGLNVQNMIDWWELYKTTKLQNNVHQYRFISKRFNCASIAIAALLAGGAGIFVKPPKPWIYYSPNDIRDYVRLLDTKLQRVNREAATINAQKLATYRDFTSSRNPLNNTAPLDPNSRDQRDDIEIWRTAEWLRQSSVMIGRRKEQVAEIDRLMNLYWGAGDKWTIPNVGEKSRCIAEILTQVQSHIITKPTSDRRKAVLTLGAQCMAVIKARASDDHNNNYLDHIIL